MKLTPFISGLCFLLLGVAVLTVTGIFAHPWAWEYEPNWKYVVATVMNPKARSYDFRYYDEQKKTMVYGSTTVGWFSFVPSHDKNIDAYYNTVTEKLQDESAPYKRNVMARVLVAILYIVGGLCTLGGIGNIGAAFM